jgi:hypothetical protein
VTPLVRARSAEAWPDAHALLSLFSTHVPGPDEDLKPDAVVDEHRVPTRVFVLGVNERRVTVYSQQCRALNLVYLLHQTGVIQRDADDCVVVIGAGAGGLTAAAAAACTGHNVILLNDAVEPMPLQRFARHRWLHPHLFDWPGRGWWNDQADLPLLDWTAADAASVRDQIIRSFNSAPWRGLICYDQAVEDVCVDPADKSSHSTGVTWSCRGRTDEHACASAVVLAVGFGLERSDDVMRPPLYRDSYWDDPGLRWSSPGRVLISGGGDGGLTEVLHAALGERFEHRRIVELAGARSGWLRHVWPEERWLSDISSEVTRFEQRWRHRLRPPAVEVEGSLDRFGSLSAAQCDQRLLEARRSGEGSAAQKVTVVVKEDDLASKSCALNRFLLARLKRHVLADKDPAGGIEILFNANLHPRSVRIANDACEVPIVERIPGASASTRVFEVDSVVIRHGTVTWPLGTFEKVRPDVARSDFSGKTAALLDATRHRVWSDSFYSDCARASGGEPLPQDPEVLTGRANATRTSARSDPRTVDDERALIVFGALEAAALADRALTPVAIERIIRGSREMVTRTVARLTQGDGSLAGDLTLNDDVLADRRSTLLGAAANRAAWRPQRDRVHEMVTLGHLRAGTLLGAVTAGKGDYGVELGAAMLGLLSRSALPWWTIYGYASVRPDDPRTQLVFARRLLADVSGHGDDPPDHLLEAAYTALRRAIWTLTRSGGDDELLGETFLETAELARALTEPGNGRLAKGFESRWHIDHGDLPAVAVLFALKAAEPRRVSAPVRWFLSSMRREIPTPPRARADRLPKFAELAGPDARRVLSQAANPDVTQIAPSAVMRAQRAVAAESRRAAEHVDWVLRYG